MYKTSSVALRVVLVLAGLFIMFTGINVGFGGIPTLGWEGENDFLSVTNPRAYAVQDSHTRFLGGLWFAVGLLFLLAVSNLAKYEIPLKLAFIAIFIGGLMRFSQMNLSVTLGPSIVGLVAIELIGTPLLYLWLHTLTKAPKETRT